MVTTTRLLARQDATAVVFLKTAYIEPQNMVKPTWNEPGHSMAKGKLS